MDDQTAIKATLDEYAVAYCAKDLDRLMAIFVRGDNISLIGTGADELCVGRAQVSKVFERNFRDATAQRFEWTWVKVAVHGDSAAVAVTVNIHLMIDGVGLVVPVRWTVALTKRDGKWLWIHRHASAAATSQDDGAAYPIDDA